MSLSFLLDTNIVSESLRPRPNARIKVQMRQHQFEMAIASIVWHELRYGCERMPPSAKREAIATYLERIVAATMPILDYDARAADWHAAERVRLEATGRTPPFRDGQIAAVAAANDLVLVTANAKDFSGFKGLRVETWS